MKTCSCGIIGDENFYKNKGTRDGLQFYCKACNAKQRKEAYRRKYTNGKNGGLRGAVPGNKNALKHGRYVGSHEKFHMEKTERETPKLAIDGIMHANWGK